MGNYIPRPFLKAYPFVIAALAGWMIPLAWKANVSLSYVLDDPASNVRERRVIRRLLASQVAAALIVQTVVTGAGLPILWAISKDQQ